MSVNRVTLLGRMGQDPEANSTETGKTYVRFSVATTESWKTKEGEKKEKTEWTNVVFWGPVSDVIAKHFAKGSEIYVEGKLQTRKYEKDGTTRYATEVVGSDFSFTGGSKKAGGSSEMGPEPSFDANDEIPF